MKTATHIIAIGFAAGLLAACSTSAPGTLRNYPERSCQEPEEIVDVLARFATSVNKGDYHAAVAYLAKEDQAKIVAPDGTIPEEMKRKLDALNFQTLANNRKIDLVDGKLTGIFDCLPCLDEGPAVKVTREPPPPPKLPPADLKEKARRQMAQVFYVSVQKNRWKAAARLVDPREWAVFLDEKGNLTELSKKRLRAIQECDLDALTLTDGELTGIVLLLEPPVSDLYVRAMAFFDLVEKDRIDAAIGMLLESEKKWFLDDKGKPRPERVAQLKALDRRDWRKLYVYHDVLLGVAEAATGYTSL